MRSLVSPSFLNRNLHYMKKRMSRTNENRKNFKVRYLPGKPYIGYCLLLLIDRACCWFLLQLVGCCCWLHWDAVDIKRTFCWPRRKRRLKITETFDWLSLSLIDYLWSWWSDAVFDWFFYSYWHSSGQERVREDSTGARTHPIYWCWMNALVADYFLLFLIIYLYHTSEMHLLIRRLTRCWTGRRRRRLSGSWDVWLIAAVVDWLLLLLIIDRCVQIDMLLDRKEKEKEKTERELGPVIDCCCCWLIAAVVDWLLCADWHAAGQEGEDWAGAATCDWLLLLLIDCCCCW